MCTCVFYTCIAAVQSLLYFSIEVFSFLQYIHTQDVLFTFVINTYNSRIKWTLEVLRSHLYKDKEAMSMQETSSHRIKCIPALTRQFLRNWSNRVRCWHGTDAQHLSCQGGGKVTKTGSDNQVLSLKWISQNTHLLHPKTSLRVQCRA